MTPRRRPLPPTLLLLLTLALPAAAGAGTLTFEPAAAVYSGAGAESATVFFSVSHEPAGYVARVVPRAGLVGADASGSARYELGGEERIALPSLWVAAELSSGEPVAASPSLPVESAELPAESFLFDAEGKPHGFLALAERYEVLVIRPGEGEAAGAWYGTSVDGSALDADGAEDGYLAVVVSQLEPVEPGGPKAPSTFAPGDRVVAIDADRLVLWTATVTDELVD